MLKAALILFVTLAAAPALAGASEWKDIAPGARARLISSDTVRGGKMLAGLEIDMPESTNIYWRIPGETGIPTEFDFSRSSGVAAPRILWPFPTIARSRGYLDYAYYGPVVIPIELGLDGARATLAVTVAMGVCDQICVPASADFSLPLDAAKPDNAQSIRLDQAVALTPIAWDGEGDAVGEVRLAADGDALILTGVHSSIDPAQLIAETGDPMLLFGPPQKSPDAATLRMPLLSPIDAARLVGRPIQLTFMTSAGAYAVTRTIAPFTN
ncbi:MAG: protein-disulfide reductase DsbD domain-containing protein [Devosia sp.]